MANVIMHVDLNYFFVRCEELKNPKLVNKPVMIGSLGRAGIVSTCSYKAREYGVRSGMPSYKALELCPSIIMCPGDFHFYSLMSKEFFAHCHTYTSKVEAASIDECYMDITNVIKNKNPISFLKEFQSKLFKKTGLMCSIGVGPTRFLAKMGSDYKKPMGITIIRKKDIKNILYPLDVSSFFGIGKKTAPKLKSIGVNTIGDLATFINKEEGIEYFGSFGEYIKSAIEGTSDNQIYLDYGDPKSISHTSTLMADTDDEEEISRVLYLMSKEVSEEAKEQKLKGKTIQLILKDPEFITHNKSMTLDKASNDVDIIFKTANSLYIKNFINKTFRLVGVALQNLIPVHEHNVQLSLFEEAPVDKVSDVVNSINRKFNRKVVDKASIMLKEKKYVNK